MNKHRDRGGVSDEPSQLQLKAISAANFQLPVRLEASPTVGEVDNMQLRLENALEPSRLPLSFEIKSPIVASVEQ